jgi:hypothetical protein
MNVSSGITATSVMIGEPHSGQKLRSTVEPLSPLSGHYATPYFLYMTMSVILIGNMGRESTEL